MYRDGYIMRYDVTIWHDDVRLRYICVYDVLTAFIMSIIEAEKGHVKKDMQ